MFYRDFRSYLSSSRNNHHFNSRSTTYNLYGADLMDAKNTEGMERLVVDTVLAFLTSHIKGSKDVAYIYTTADTEQFNTHTTDPGTYSLEGDLFS